MRILIYIPLSPVSPRVQMETIGSIMALDWYGPLDVMMGREDMDRLPDTEMKYANLTAKCNQAAAITRAGNYDALLIVEADMIVPHMALQRMTVIDADVVYGLYCSRRKSRNWLVFSEVTADPFAVKKLGGTPEDRNKIWGNVVESQGMGLGCTFIHREVLDKIRFRCPDPQVSCDWYFAVDCKEAGLRQVHDCGTACGHIDGDVIIWPEPDHGFWLEG